MKKNYVFIGQGCQSAASSLKLFAQATLISIDTCQKGLVRTTDNVGSNALSGISPPLITSRNEMSYTRSQQSRYSNIRQFN